MDAFATVCYYFYIYLCNLDAIVCAKCNIGDYDHSNWIESGAFDVKIWIVGAILSNIFVVIGCVIVGFRQNGIASGTLASSWRSSIGNVKGNSIFSCLQSMIMAGAPFIVIGIIGAAISYVVFLKLNKLQMCC